MFQTMLVAGLGVGAAYLKMIVPDAAHVSDFLTYLGYLDRSTGVIGLTVLNTVFNKVGQEMNSFVVDSLDAESTIDLSSYDWSSDEASIRTYLKKMLRIMLNSEQQEEDALVSAVGARRQARPRRARGRRGQRLNGRGLARIASPLALPQEPIEVSTAPGARRPVNLFPPTPGTGGSVGSDGDGGAGRVHLSKQEKDMRRIENGTRSRPLPLHRDRGGSEGRGRGRPLPPAAPGRVLGLHRRRRLQPLRDYPPER